MVTYNGGGHIHSITFNCMDYETDKIIRKKLKKLSVTYVEYDLDIKNLSVSPFIDDNSVYNMVLIVFSAIKKINKTPQLSVIK